MEINLIDTIGGFTFIIMGLWFAIYHNSLGAKAVYHQSKFWSRLNINISFAERSLKAYQIMFLIVGIIFLLVGILFVFHIIESK